SEASASKVGQLVFLLLCLPCFHLSNVFFQLAYLLQQRILRRVGRDCVLLGGEDYSVEFDGLLQKLGVIPNPEKALRDFCRSIEARQQAPYCPHISHCVPPSGASRASAGNASPSA